KFDAIDVGAAPGSTPPELRTRIGDALPKGYQAKTGAEAAAEGASEVKKALGFLNVAFLVFAFISLFVGAFIIYNTFSILVGPRAYSRSPPCAIRYRRPTGSPRSGPSREPR